MRAVHAVVRAVDADERVADVLQGGLVGVVHVGLDEGDAHPSLLGRADATTATQAELRLLLHLDLGDDPARRWIPARELDAGRLAHHAAAPVATDQILRPQRCAVGQRDVDAAVVLRETGHLTFAQDRHPQLVDPAGQDALEVALQQRQPVVVAGGEVADVQRDPGERLRPASPSPPRGTDRRRRADRAPRWCASADRRRASCRAPELARRSTMSDVDPRQRQLRRQHHPRRTAAGDHHRMLGHSHTPVGHIVNNTRISRLPSPSALACGGRSAL